MQKLEQCSKEAATLKTARINLVLRDGFARHPRDTSSCCDHINGVRTVAAYLMLALHVFIPKIQDRLAVLTGALDSAYRLKRDIPFPQLLQVNKIRLSNLNKS
ncbi:hypothetical protein RRG08_044608 [Elysia crispata]|uniref:Uncharacterized protein n=1 Tax=Elysia crispata TaxID=231223 RepID=A0AAE0YN10_9GAST|nr:hypothetical protein RRG08_044608 [Elysia crispata]